MVGIWGSVYIHLLCPHTILEYMVHILDPALEVQLPATADLGRQQVVAQALTSMPPTWENQMGLQVIGSRQAMLHRHSHLRSKAEHGNI